MRTRIYEPGPYAASSAELAAEVQRVEAPREFRVAELDAAASELRDGERWHVLRRYQGRTRGTVLEVLHDDDDGIVQLYVRAFPANSEPEPLTRLRRRIEAILFASGFRPRRD
ncbi:MAG: hypothetical protein H6828_00780 [Planctomycetes bacterium]|nr:hypothetical protein [Planctomycetota bacterium]